MALHWITAILVAVAFFYGPGGPESRVYSAARDFERELHETLGLAVLAVSVLRVFWLAFTSRPDVPPAQPWMRTAALLIQGSLYALIFLVPLTAMFGAWLEGHPLTLMAGSVVPSPLPVDHQVGTLLAKVHSFLGDAILWLAAIHAAAALYHHYVLKDGVLQSMVPSNWFMRR